MEMVVDMVMAMVTVMVMAMVMVMMMVMAVVAVRGRGGLGGHKYGRTCECALGAVSSPQAIGQLSVLYLFRASMCLVICLVLCLRVPVRVHAMVECPT